MSSRAAWLAPILLISLFVSLTLAIWWPSNFVRLSSFAIGEQFEAYHGALNIQRFGWRWAGVQDEATNPDVAAHPFLYTHHGNNGIYFSYILLQLGINSLPLQNALSIIASAGGLLVAFLCFRKLTGSIPFATVALAILSLDFDLIRDWSVNIHRGLTYLSVFGAVYVFVEASERNFRHPGWTAGAFLVCLNLLGTDYFYFIFTGLVIIAWVLLNTETWATRIWRVATIGAMFVAAFALRQLQIALALGWESWTQDLLFQLINRLHLQFLYTGDWAKRTEEFYASRQILNTGFPPAIDAHAALLRFISDSGAALLTNVLGLGTAGYETSLTTGKFLFIGVAAITVLGLLGRRLEAQRLSLIALIWALALMAGSVVGNLGFGSKLSTETSLVFAAGCIVGIYRYGMWPNEPAANVGSDRRVLFLGVSTLAGCIGLMLTLSALFGSWYPQFQLDSICAATWMSILVLPYLQSAAFAKHWRSSVGLAVVIKAMSLATLLSTLPPPGGDHTEALPKLRGLPTVSNFTPASVASYTHAFSGLIKPEGARKLLSGGSVGPDDYLWLTERDRTNPMYQRPKYLVFYKGISIFADDWSVLSGYVPIAEGNDYAIYAIPSQRRSSP
jgi:hypothetical protein